MLTAAGSGYSQCARPRGHALARGRHARPLGHVRLPARSGERRGLVGRPTSRRRSKPDAYEVAFSEDRAEIRRRDGDDRDDASRSPSRPRTTPRCAASSLTNLGPGPREIEVTSYCELVLAPPAADAAHPAFSNLFVETESVPELDALLATTAPARARRARGVGGARRRRRGRRERGARSTRPTARASSAAAAASATPLSSSTAGRSRTRPARCSTRSSACAAGSASRPGAQRAGHLLHRSSRPRGSEALALADKYRDPATFERAATLAWTQAQVQLHHLGIEPRRGAPLPAARRTASSTADPTLRAAAGGPRAQRRRAAPALWAHGISGDLPIVLVRIDEPEDTGIVRQLLRAHEYWRLKGLAVDLVILNEQATSYVQDLQGALEALVRTSQSRLGTGTRRTAASSSCAPISSRRAERERARRRRRGPCSWPATARSPIRSVRAAPVARGRRPPSPSGERDAGAGRRICRRAAPELEFFNGLGGFADDGREYVTVLGDGAVDAGALDQRRRQPGVRLPGLGVGRRLHLVRATAGRTSSRPGPTTPSPIRRARSLYVRDEETGELWGPTPLPIRGGRRALRRAPRPGLQPLRAHRARHRARPRAVRAAGATR